MALSIDAAFAASVGAIDAASAGQPVRAHTAKCSDAAETVDQATTALALYMLAADKYEEWSMAAPA